MKDDMPDMLTKPINLDCQGEYNPIFQVYKDGVWEEKELEIAYRVGNNFIYKFTDEEGYLWTVAIDQNTNITDVSRQ